jgi:hypothetical protein
MRAATVDDADRAQNQQQAPLPGSKGPPMKHLRKLTLAAVTALALLAPLAAATNARAAGPVVWNESEINKGTFNATWTWNASKKFFVGRWNNGAVAILKVEKLDKTQVILTRRDPQGASAGLEARYVGSRNGKSFQGTVEWTWRGVRSQGTWKAFPQTARSNAPTPFNRRRFPNERSVLQGRERATFPYLGTNYEVLGPNTGPAAKAGSYNCIAWTVGITNRWQWPGYTVTSFDTYYGGFGYRRISSLDYRYQPGVAKIVLYGKKKADGSIETTHGARQLKDGTWSSKLGGLALIRHQTPDSLDGPSYGRPVAVYVRARK